MIQRLELAHEDGLVGIRTSNDGEYVLYHYLQGWRND